MDRNACGLFQAYDGAQLFSVFVLKCPSQQKLDAGQGRVSPGPGFGRTRGAYAFMFLIGRSNVIWRRYVRPKEGGSHHSVNFHWTSRAVGRRCGPISGGEGGASGPGKFLSMSSVS
ncbi:hypothetical protein AOLI_G00011630 [Acnodon oligacanthus]